MVLPFRGLMGHGEIDTAVSELYVASSTKSYSFRSLFNSRFFQAAAHIRSPRYVIFGGLAQRIPRVLTSLCVSICARDC